MYPDIIAIGIPVMVAFVVFEFLHDLRKKLVNYRINAAISNIGCGIFEQVTGFISKGLFIALYVFIYEHWRLNTFADTFWIWVSLIVFVDFVFYFFHRFSHRCSFLWAGHMVHHEVGEFNLTVALRRSVMQEFTIIGVYLPFAVLGFSPRAFFLSFAAHNLYQFLIHTRYSPELKLFGLVFNTPHHHEIHHARNDCYIDKNFAGVFILWDKLFGTYTEHTEAPVFGIGQRTRTLNPVTAQITTMMLVLQEARRRMGWRQKISALFGPPDYLSVEQPSACSIAASTAVPGRHVSFDPTLSRGDWWLVGSGFITLIVCTTVYRNYEHAFSTPQKLFALAIIASSLYAIGRLLDNRKSQRLRLAVALPTQRSPNGDRTCN